MMTDGLQPLVGSIIIMLSLTMTELQARDSALGLTFAQKALHRKKEKAYVKVARNMLQLTQKKGVQYG